MSIPATESRPRRLHDAFSRRDEHSDSLTGRSNPFGRCATGRMDTRGGTLFMMSTPQIRAAAHVRALVAQDVARGIEL